MLLSCLLTWPIACWEGVAAADFRCFAMCGRWQIPCSPPAAPCRSGCAPAPAAAPPLPPLSAIKMQFVVMHCGRCGLRTCRSGRCSSLRRNRLCPQFQFCRLQHKLNRRRRHIRPTCGALRTRTRRFSFAFRSFSSAAFFASSGDSFGLMSACATQKQGCVPLDGTAESDGSAHPGKSAAVDAENMRPVWKLQCRTTFGTNSGSLTSVPFT